MDENSPNNEADPAIQNPHTSDVVDAQIVSDEPLSQIVDFTTSSQSPEVSLSDIPAGELLLSPKPQSNVSSRVTSPSSVTGADVIRNFKPRSRMVDSEVNIEQVLKDLDQAKARVPDSKQPRSESTTDESIYEFTVDGASDAVKHFFYDEITSNVANDEVDASGEGATSEHQEHLDVTTNQPQDASSKRKRRENQFRYNMNHTYRGCFVIFNHEVFDDYNALQHEDLGTRTGTKKDAANLEHMARQIGFEFIRTIDDATKNEITEWITRLSQANHSDYDCFACAILSHGGDRDIIYARDAKMKLSDFTRPFGADKCPTLAMKPKLFFIQEVLSDEELERVPEPIITVLKDYQNFDCFISEYYAFRNQSNGSIFIQCVCAVFNSFGDTMELMQLMTRVNRMMAYEFESSTAKKEYDGKKQIPSIATRLTAEVYFPPKKVFQEQNEVYETKMEVDGRTRTKPSIESDNFEQGSQNMSLREASYAPQHSHKSFYPQQPSKSDEVFTTSVQETHQQGYGDRLDIPHVEQSIPMRGRSSTITIPPRTKSEEDAGLKQGTTGFHVSRTEPVSIESLRGDPGNRLTLNRHSFPEARRLVKQETDNVLLVGGKKTNVYYEESDV